MSGTMWSNKDKQYLTDHWGTISLKTLSKKLGRSENAILNKAQRWKLGPFLKNGDYVSWNEFLRTMNLSGGYKVTSWIRNRGLPVHTKRVNNCSFKIIYIDEFWDWAEKNKSFLDFSKLEENMLGKEPAWVKVKRKQDYENKQKIKVTPWTSSEDSKLEYMLKKHLYGVAEISKELNRTSGAVGRRIYDLGLKEIPIKADVHNPYDFKDEVKIKMMILKGINYEKMQEELGRSSKAIRGKVYRMYGTENLDKARLVIKQGGEKDE